MPPDDFQQWIAPVQSRMVNCTWRIVRDATDAEDVMQEVLLHVYKRIETIKRHPNPTALLIRICTQKALDHLRRRKTQSGRNDPLSEVLADCTPTPRQEALAAEHRRQLLAFIRTMPPREAEAITLHALEGIGYPETATAMGCTESTARVLVGRARERFRRAFGGAGRTTFLESGESSSSPKSQPSES